MKKALRLHTLTLPPVCLNTQAAPSASLRKRTPQPRCTLFLLLPLSGGSPSCHLASFVSQMKLRVSGESTELSVEQRVPRIPEGHGAGPPQSAATMRGTQAGPGAGDSLKRFSFLSACRASSLVKGKSNQRERLRLSCIVLPNISIYDGARSIACEPIWIRMPVITIVLLLLLISMVKPPGWRGERHTSETSPVPQGKAAHSPDTVSTCDPRQVRYPGSSPVLTSLPPKMGTLRQEADSPQACFS